MLLCCMLTGMLIGCPQGLQPRALTGMTPLCTHHAGIETAASTVTVAGARLRIDLHSPLPDGSIQDYKEHLDSVGGLAREPAGVIRTWESYQLQLAYTWRTLLGCIADLRARW
jgi:hypothetical protein